MLIDRSTTKLDPASRVIISCSTKSAQWHELYRITWLSSAVPISLVLFDRLLPEVVVVPFAVVRAELKVAVSVVVVREESEEAALLMVTDAELKAGIPLVVAVVGFHVVVKSEVACRSTIAVAVVSVAAVSVLVACVDDADDMMRALSILYWSLMGRSNNLKR